MAKASSALDRIKALDEERAKLLDEAKATALTAAQEAIADLNALGFNYQLVQSGQAPRATRTPSTGNRRSGIRENVLSAVLEAGPDGLTPAQIREKLGIDNADKSGSQSVANALSNLKKAGKIGDQNGAYIAA